MTAEQYETYISGLEDCVTHLCAISTILHNRKDRDPRLAPVLESIQDVEATVNRILDDEHGAA